MSIVKNRTELIDLIARNGFSQTKARQILSALESAGLAIVPAFPSPDMQMHGLEHVEKPRVTGIAMVDVWDAMLSQSPYREQKE